METMQQSMSTTDTDLWAMSLRMETMQQGMSTTDTDLQGMSSRMAAMQQSMSTIQGPNPPAWFVRLISVNTADIKQSYEVPLWIRGADIIQNNLTTFTRYVYRSRTILHSVQSLCQNRGRAKPEKGPLVLVTGHAIVGWVCASAQVQAALAAAAASTTTSSATVYGSAEPSHLMHHTTQI
eukprot:3251335-Amphidinium_carterae.1